MEENKFSHLSDTDEMVYCRICGEFYKRLYSSHLKKAHSITSKEYKLMFPNAPLYSKNDFENSLQKTIAKNRTPENRQKTSEKIKGENNPNHKSKTTEAERKSRSPYSKDFIKYKDLTEEETDKVLKQQVKDINEYRLLSTQVEYYTRDGYSIEEAKAIISKLQNRFSLEICIEKYGLEEGTKRFEERQQKWLKSLHENGNLKMGYSKVSQELFDKILEHYSDLEKSNIYYALKSHEFSLYENNKIYNYDFVDDKQKKIIEFNGDIFHANPNIYAPYDTPNPHRPNQTSEDIWMYDLGKMETAEKNGYEYFIVWEYTYRIEPIIVLERCLKFLNLT